MTSRPRNAAPAFPEFRAFCIDNWDAITELLATRLVQTNEVRRCAYLLPTFNLVATLTDGRPLALVEVGASAGLNLLFDRYRYTYDLEGKQVEAGRTAGAVVIDAVVHWERPAPLGLGTPDIASRTGIDLNPVDLSDERAFRWLLALIWPEHHDRFQRLKLARQVWLAEPPELVRGDALELLPEILAAIPSDCVPVIFHTHVLNQFSTAAVNEMEVILTKCSQERPFYRVGNDFAGLHHKRYALRMFRYAHGEASHKVVAYVDGHGRWFTWLGTQLSGVYE